MYHKLHLRFPQAPQSSTNSPLPSILQCCSRSHPGDLSNFPQVTNRIHPNSHHRGTCLPYLQTLPTGELLGPGWHSIRVKEENRVLTQNGLIGLLPVHAFYVTPPQYTEAIVIDTERTVRSLLSLPLELCKGISAKF